MSCGNCGGAGHNVRTCPHAGIGASHRDPIRGVELWRGRSRLTGDPIVAIATGLSGATTNPKTGGMLQAWILVQGENPGNARRSGADEAVCGTCPHRPMDGWGTCYVNVAWSAGGVWKAWRAGRYPRATTAWRREIRKRHLRIGAYGDPVAVPVQTWRALLTDETRRATGYTHAWRTPNANLYQPFLMASVESVAEAREAQALGWRTFLVLPDGASVPSGMLWCPSDKKNPGPTVPCESCGECSGAAGHTKNVAIYAHGGAARRFDPTKARREGWEPPPRQVVDPVVRMNPALLRKVRERVRDSGGTMKGFVERAVRAELGGSS